MKDTKSMKDWYKKVWVSCDLPKETAGRFKEYLRDNQITFKTSKNGYHIHFKCLMDIYEQIAANDFISERC